MAYQNMCQESAYSGVRMVTPRIGRDGDVVLGCQSTHFWGTICKNNIGKIGPRTHFRVPLADYAATSWLSVGWASAAEYETEHNPGLRS